MDIKSLNGLPAHPLLVHIPIVLVPLSTLGAVLMLWPRLRARIGWATVFVAGVATVATFLAVGSGEALGEAVEGRGSERLLEDHTEIGANLRPWILLLFLTVLTIMLLDRHRTRRALGAESVPADWREQLEPSPTSGAGGVATATATTTATGTATVTRSGLQTAAVVLSALSIFFGALSSYWIYRIGHTGAKATWEKTQLQLERSGGGEGGTSSDTDE